MNFFQNIQSNLVLFFSFIRKNLAVITICIIAVVVLKIDITLKYWNDTRLVIEYDVKSYYAYLPATFIYKDISLGFIDKDPEKFKPIIWPVETPEGNKVIVTTMGLSFLYMPFFLIAHIITPFTEFEADGYTAPYKFALMMSCLVYLIIGLIYLKRILERYFNQYITSLTLFAVVIGTNLLMYAFHHDAPMSHVYNFALINIFLYYVIKWFEKPTYKYTIILGLISGLITLIRPTNILVLLILFFYDIRSFKDIRLRVVYFLNSYKKVLIMIASFVLVWIPQFVYWKYISGHFLFDAYGELGGVFHFDNPQIFNFLFSYRKGWLLYTPIMIIAILGIPVLYYKMRQFFMPILIYLVIMIYVLSSWWSWWFGGGFGMRSLIDMYGILAIPFAAFINYSFRWKKIAGFLVTTIVVVFIWFNTFQSRQYVNQAIHWAWMTKEAYWNTFLKLYPQKEFWTLLREYDNELAKKGIYVEIEPELYKEINKPKKPLSREERIKEIENRIRGSEPLLKVIEEKAKKRGVSLDSMVLIDATWLYDKELEKGN